MDQKIAEQVPEIDVVVGGHSRTFLYSGGGEEELPLSSKQLEQQPQPAGPYPTIVEQAATGKRVPVVQAYAYAKYLGKLTLTFSDDGNHLRNWTGNPILLDDNSSYAEGQLSPAKKI